MRASLLAHFVLNQVQQKGPKFVLNRRLTGRWRERSVIVALQCSKQHESCIVRSALWLATEPFRLVDSSYRNHQQTSAFSGNNLFQPYVLRYYSSAFRFAKNGTHRSRSTHSHLFLAYKQYEKRFLKIYFVDKRNSVISAE